MPRCSCWVSRIVLCSLLLSAVSAPAAEFNVSLPADMAAAPIDGRLYVFLSQSERGEPRFGPNWFSPEPFYRLDVTAFAADEDRTLDDAAAGFPHKPSQLPPGKWHAQAVLDHDFYHSEPAQGVGNFYSDIVTFEVAEGANETIAIALTKTVEPVPFPESEWVREVTIVSKLLSDFHGREVVDRCAVVLPEGYDAAAERRYPVIYSVPGFSGTHLQSASFPAAPQANEGETDFIRVFLSGQCKWGHHVYADSATNGPRGRSLVEELIPRIDELFRTVAAPTARFLTGHSSGGWSSLWLQVSYPDTFGGVWSTSPDPVDFRDYQQVDLYVDPPLSLYVDEAGERRPIARRGTEAVLWYDSFGRMDDVLGRGGQLRSFEAVFSPLGEDGLPRKLWDRETGRVDPEVARAWEAYDIRLKLERNWPELQPKLAGKLHVVMGDLDTFYLDGAVALLKETLAQLGSDAEVEMVPGADHGSVLTADRVRTIRRQMSQAFWKHHPAE